MKTVLSIAVIAIVVFVAGCSSMSVHHDVDKSADFSVYKTFRFTDSAGVDTGADADQTDSKDSPMGHAESTTRELLVEKGLKFDPDNPDLLVTFHSGEENKIDVDGFGYSYSGEYSGWQDAGIGIYPYKEGTLVVDLVDARTKNLVWRGSAQGVMYTGTKGQRNKLITKALNEMFEKYPPS